MRQWARAEIVGLLVWLASGMAQAATCTSKANGNWNSAGTWSCTAGTTPAAGDTVVINHQVTLNNNYPITNVTINAGGVLVDDSNTRTLTISGNLTLNGAVNNGGGRVNLNVTGNSSVVSGSGALNSARVYFSGTAPQIAAGANLTFNGNSRFYTGRNLAGAPVASSVLTINGTINSNVPIATTNFMRLYANSTVIGATGVLNAGVSDIRYRTATATLTNKGSVTIGQVVGNAATSTWTNAANSTLNVLGPLLATGTLNASAAGNTVNYNGAAQTVKPATYANLTLSGSGAKSMAATTINGNFTMSGTATTSPTGALTIGGNMTLNAGTTFNAGAFNHSVAGNLTLNGTFTPGTSTLTLNGATAQTINAATPITFNNLTITNTANPNITLGTNVTVNGTLTGTPILTSTCPTDYTLTHTGGTAVEHSCPAATLMADYRMDEAAWSGTPNEVLDSSGHGLHGQAFLGATTAPGKVCNAGNFNANYAQAADNPLLDITNNLTVSVWIKPSRCGGAPGKDALMSFYSKDANYEAHVTNTCRINWWWGTGNITSAAAVPVNAWSHVAMVWKTGSQRLYINGALSASGTVGGTLPVNALPFQIGDDQGFGGGTRRFDGQIDELKVFNSAFSAAQISSLYTNENAGNNWDGSARTCPVSGPHHFEIQHADGQGVTCTPSTLTIKACANATCTIPYTAGVSGTLSATGGPTVNWGGGTPNFTIPPASSTVTKDIQVTTLGSVTLDATATPVPPGATTCSWGPCTFTAANAAFLVSAPDHVAESASTLTIQAVKVAPGDPLVCVPGMTGTKAVNLKCGYTDPVTGTQAVRVAGMALNAGNNPAAACDAGGANVNLTFDSSGIAKPSLQYADVGRMSVTASYTGTGMEAGLVMTGSGNFIAAPASFGVVWGAGPVNAGNPASATVTARNAVNNATPNFGHETAPEGVTLTHALAMGPGVWNNPALGGTTTIPGASFTGGAATVSDLTWAEVGVINLNANLSSGSYLGSGLTASGSTPSPLTLIPHHYTTEIVSAGGAPMVCPDGSCPSNVRGASGMVYSGQPFTVKVTAKTAADNNPSGPDNPAHTTQNYKLAYAQDVNLSGVGGVGGPLSNPLLTAANFSAGVATTTAMPSWSLGVAPTAPSNVAIRATGTGVSSSVSSSGAHEGALRVAQGRLKFANAYGSEKLPLSFPVKAEYCATVTLGACDWAASATDDATQFNSATNLTKTIITGPLTAGDVSVVGAGLVTLVSGSKTLQLNVPNKTGVVDLCVNAPAYLTCQTGRMTFGVYKGRNEFIYLRESY